MAKARLEHGKIGLRTHAAGAAAAHVRYILRESACVAAVTRDEDGNRLTMTTPDQLARRRTDASAWLSECERGAARKDERVCDTLTLTFASDLAREERITSSARSAKTSRAAALSISQCSTSETRTSSYAPRCGDEPPRPEHIGQGLYALLERAWRDVAKQSAGGGALFAERSLSGPERNSEA